MAILDLLNKKTLKTLRGAQTAKVIDYSAIENEKGGYISVKFQLEDREYVYNLFPSQVDYVVSCLKRQLELNDSEDSLAEILELAKTNEVNIWFSYNQEYRTMNLAFHEPAAEVTMSEIERAL